MFRGEERRSLAGVGAEFTGGEVAPSVENTSSEDEGRELVVGEDGEGTLTIEVKSAPTANDGSDVTGEEVPVTTDVVANDTDPNGDLNPSTVRVQSSPSDGSATANADGTITYDPTPASWAPTRTPTPSRTASVPSRTRRS